MRRRRDGFLVNCWDCKCFLGHDTFRNVFYLRFIFIGYFSFSSRSPMVIRDFEVLKAFQIHYVNDRKVQLDFGSLICLWFSKHFLSIRWAEYMIHHNTLFVSNAWNLMTRYYITISRSAWVLSSINSYLQETREKLMD